MEVVVIFFFYMWRCRWSDSGVLTVACSVAACAHNELV